MSLWCQGSRSLRFARPGLPLGLPLGLLLAALLQPAVLPAQNCPWDGTCGFQACKTPARPASSSLWGEIQPVDPDPLPAARDNTNFNEFATTGHPADRYGSAEPFWESLDTDGSYVYAAISHGLQVWDVRANPASPVFVKTVDGPSTFRQWPSGEKKQLLYDIDVEGDLGAASGKPAVGVGLFDFTDRTRPRLMYQDSNKDGNQVYVTKLGGRTLAFLAASNPNTASEPSGLLVYDLDAARVYQGCLQSTGSCFGVYLGKVGSRSAFGYVDGAGPYVIASVGPLAGFDIYDVTNPQAATMRLNGLAGQSVYGVALWKDGTKYYAGLVISYGSPIVYEVRTYDVSCIATTAASCTLGAALDSYPVVRGSVDLYLTYSKNGARSFLYFGTDQVCGTTGPAREFLLEVTNPADIRNVNPPQLLLIDNVGIDYWSWYYKQTPTGFTRVGGRMGKFSGNYFYRAATAIFDIHKLTSGAAPAADFALPATVYSGMPVQFTDGSSGSVTSRTWTFEDGTATAPPPAPKPANTAPRPPKKAPPRR